MVGDWKRLSWIGVCHIDWIDKHNLFVCILKNLPVEMKGIKVDAQKSIEHQLRAVVTMEYLWIKTSKFAKWRYSVN